MIQNRRKFISTIVAGGAAVPFLSRINSFLPDTASKNFPIRFFSKPLDTYDFDFLCECVTGSGIGGIDLTVRPGGKVEPEKVEAELPMIIKKARESNLAIDMIVTGIVSANDPYTTRILETASSNGVKYYRLGWLEYNKTDIWGSLQKYRTGLKDLVALNAKYKINGGYQNHAGEMVGSPVWDLHELLRDLPPEYIGSQYDVRHAMAEGSASWTLGMRLIAPYIKTLAIKDFTWETTGGKTQPVTVPLGEGVVDWDLYFKMVKELGIVAPITLHAEYPLLEKGDEKLTPGNQKDIIVRKLKKDTDFIKSYLNKYQL